MIYNDYNYENVCNFCAVFIALFAIPFLIIVDISSPFVYFHCYLKGNNTIITNIDTNTEIVIY